MVSLSTYESKVKTEHRNLLEEQGIDGFLREIGGDDYVRTLSIALAHFCFRNGPIESMHAEPGIGLTEECMKTLNKFMVDKPGLFLLLLSCEDAGAINSILACHKQCGSEWDDPDLVRELENCGIDPERPYLMRKLLRGAEAHRPQQVSPKASGEARTQPPSPHDPLKACPHCGTELLKVDAKTRLPKYIDLNRSTNKAVAEAAGVLVAIVSGLQHYSEEAKSEKLRRQSEAVAEVLRVPSGLHYSFDPLRSTVRCVNCGATALWSVWIERFKVI